MTALFCAKIAFLGPPATKPLQPPSSSNNQWRRLAASHSATRYTAWRADSFDVDFQHGGQQFWHFCVWQSSIALACVRGFVLGVVAMVIGFVLIKLGDKGNFNPWAMPSAAVVKTSTDAGSELAAFWGF